MALEVLVARRVGVARTGLTQHSTAKRPLVVVAGALRSTGTALLAVAVAVVLPMLVQGRLERLGKVTLALTEVPIELAAVVVLAARGQRTTLALAVMVQ